MDDKFWMGLVQLCIAVGIPTLGFVMAAARFYQRTRDDVSMIRDQYSHLSDDVKMIGKSINELNLEVYPAKRNGGIVTSEQLDRRLEIIEKSYEENTKIITRYLDNLSRSNATYHGMTEDKLVEIIRRTIRT